jgi:hypothetical protein
MSKFLDHREVGPAITKLMKGKSVRCAVAFWGTGAAQKLFMGGALPSGSRIICDVSMGGSNPHELESMGAPYNLNLKHIRGLHAKIYFSDDGLIVCSANASNNGIGFTDAPALFEAGVFHSAQSEVFAAAHRWFEAIWRTAAPLDERALTLARRNWPRGSPKSPLSRTKRKLDSASLFDAVVDKPGRFDTIGFAFTTSIATTQDVKKAAKRYHDDHASDHVPISPAESERINNWPTGDLFSSWPRVDIEVWPMFFINAHRPRNKLSYYPCKQSYRVVLDSDSGSIMSSNAPDLKSQLKLEQSLQAMAKVDNERAQSVFAAIEKSGQWFFRSGRELAAFLRELEAWA